MIEINKLPVLLTSIAALMILNTCFVFFKKRYILSKNLFICIYSLFYISNIAILSMLFYNDYYPYIRLFTSLDLLFLFSIYIFKNQCIGLFLFLCNMLKLKNSSQFREQDTALLGLSVLKSLYFCFCLFIVLQVVYYQFSIFIFISVLFFLGLTDLIEMFINAKMDVKNIFMNQIKYFFFIISLAATYNVFIFIFCLSFDYFKIGINYLRRKIS
jgi:hypothetical protein